jgi:hypothetical protein
MFTVVYVPERHYKWLSRAHYRIQRPDGSFFKAIFDCEADAKELCVVLNDTIEVEEK